MFPYRNLVSDSLLVSEAIYHLQSNGGSAAATEIVERVMKILQPAPELARNLVMDLVALDPRLQMNGDTLALAADDAENRSLAETEFVVFDTETTGAKTPPCRITEIGAFKVRGGEIVDRFETLINPETNIPPFIVKLTGISNQMVKGAPRFYDVANDFLEFIGDAVLVAHNAHFDMRFINHEVGRVFRDYRVGNRHLCTVQLSRRILPDIANHRLHTVADYYRISIENRHRAGGDALATAQVFIHFLEHFSEMGMNDLNAIHKFRK